MWSTVVFERKSVAAGFGWRSWRLESEYSLRQLQRSSEGAEGSGSVRSSVLKMAKFFNMFGKSNKVFADELKEEQARWRAEMISLEHEQ